METLICLHSLVNANIIYIKSIFMIQQFADWLVYGIFGLDAKSHWGSAVNFFFYDTIKIIILLFLISMLMGIINAYFPIDRLRKFLATRKLYGLQYFFASLFGAITPFCSCSSIPLFLYWRKQLLFLSSLSALDLTH